MKNGAPLANWRALNQARQQYSSTPVSSASNIWISLLAFNLGVEFGQLAIVLLIWPLLLLIIRRFPHLTVPLKWAIAMPCIGIASVWVGQRMGDVLASFSG